ncbi:MAG: leucine-rich repeat domain-containing protein [Candidatus Poribacteria bacterium]|nr:leucine-rich repeat domain-containing protein [Candidatus Poribacteria bacterium]
MFMKKIHFLTFTLLLVLTLFLPLSVATAQLKTMPDNMVRLVYFSPKDRPMQPEYESKLRQLIKETQQVFAQNMENHGFDRKTFQIETDAQGMIVVHRVKGRFNHAYYRNNWNEAWEESYEQLEANDNNIIFTLLDVDLQGIAVCGRGGGNGRSGRAFVTPVPTDFGCFNLRIVAHELGHAFGLHHDYRLTGDWMTALGNSDSMLSSFSTAEWLNVIPAFNTNPTHSNENTTIEMLAPKLAGRPNMLRLRFNVADPDGLHQVQLLTVDLSRNDSFPGLVDYKAGKGDPKITVEFVATAVRPEIKEVLIHTIDVNGNTKWQSFPIDITTLLPPSKVVLFPDTNLAAAVRQEIGNSITTHTLLNLTHLDVRNRGITDLTGIEHAHFLTYLDLGGQWIDGKGYVNSNTISDYSPIAGLTELRNLYLRDQSITDLSMLRSLKELRYLDLSYNRITDVSVLAGLKQLKYLNLNVNNIRDASPLVDLEQLRVRNAWIPDNVLPGPSLYLKGNPLSYTSINTYIPAMQANGVEAELDNRVPSTFVKISGDAQEDETGTTLANPFVVEVRDQQGQVYADVPVTFTIVTGGGKLSVTTATTNAAGWAETTLTLGSGTNEIRVTAPQMKDTVSFTAIATEAVRLATDVNGDGIVNIQDLVLVAANLGKTGENKTDVNEDSIIDIRDLVLVAGALGNTVAAPSLLYPDPLEMLTTTQVKQWLSQAQRADLTDVTSQRGILMLQQLLAARIPKETSLLANYPNPFNPETWIPYQLAEPADVTLTIYTSDGTVVRTLMLGHQPVGIYQAKNRAAYWDGKNEVGESVANGVYFYTLTTGNFSATKKMLIRK